MSLSLVITVSLGFSLIVILSLLCIALRFAEKKGVANVALTLLCGLALFQSGLSLVALSPGLGFVGFIKPSMAMLIGPILLFGVYEWDKSIDQVYLKRWWPHALVVLPVITMQMAGNAHFIDSYIFISTGIYLLLSLIIYLQNRELYSKLVPMLLSVVTVILSLDLLTAYSANSVVDYRESLSYQLALMLILLAGSTLIIYLLRQKSVLYRPQEKITLQRIEIDEGISKSKFEAYMKNSAVYRNSQANLTNVAEALDIQARKLSYWINRQYGKNFSAYMNSLRIEEATDRLLCSNDSVTTIFYDVGFRTKSAFYKEFRRHHNMSPTSYRESYSSDIAKDMGKQKK